MCTQVGDQDPEIFVPVIEFESVQCCFVLLNFTSYNYVLCSLLFCCYFVVPLLLVCIIHCMIQYRVNNFDMFFSVLKIVGLHYEVALALVDYSTTCTRCKYYFVLK